MRRGLSYSDRRRPSVLVILGWLVLVGFGVAMIWFGLLQPYLASRQESDPEATPSSEGTETGTPVSALYPTFTPAVSPIQVPTLAPTVALVQPTSLPAEPTTPPPSPTPTEEATRARAVVGEGGVNFRSGPGTNYELYELIPEGTEVDVIGQYPDWWKIRYSDQEGWVFGGLVTAYDTEGVPQAEAPPSPVPPPATEAPPPPPEPTEAPSSSGPSAVTEIRGIVADKFEVEGAPGPYAVGQDIWFHMWITNKTGAPVEYQYLGVQVEENGEVQKSWIYSEFAPNKQFHHRDHLYDQISSPGTYHLWLVIMFRDGNGFRLAGPVEVIVQ